MKEKETDKKKKKSFKILKNILAFAVFIVFLIFIYIKYIVVIVGPGERAIKFETIRGRMIITKTYGEGLHMKFPWNQLIIYDVRIQQNNLNLEILSQSGIRTNIDLIIIYKINIPKLPKLHLQIGPDYKEKIIIPYLSSISRINIGSKTIEELWSTDREKITDEISLKLKGPLSKRYITLLDILIHEITLPKHMNESILRKLVYQQRQLEYQWRIKREKREIVRKEIEAKGISVYHNIISKTITPNLLNWQRILATQSLIESPNASIIMLGEGKHGLPTIFD